MTPEDRWRAHLEWQDATFEMFLMAQVSQGRTREEALALLKKAWEREDRERIESWRRAAQITSRAR